jgi:hypothetical protein
MMVCVMFKWLMLGLHDDGALFAWHWLEAVQVTWWCTFWFYVHINYVSSPPFFKGKNNTPLLILPFFHFLKKETRFFRGPQILKNFLRTFLRPSKAAESYFSSADRRFQFFPRRLFCADSCVKFLRPKRFLIPPPSSWSGKRSINKEGNNGGCSFLWSLGWSA